MMEKFNTDTERKLFEWVYRLQLCLAKNILEERNKEMLKKGKANHWPAQQEWGDLSGSSQAIFLREARVLSEVPNDDFLILLRQNEEAIGIVSKIIN